MARSAPSYGEGKVAVLSDPALRRPRGRAREARSDVVRFWSDGAGTGLDVAAARFVHHAFRPHTHDQLMLGLIDRGTKSFRRERARFLAGPGAISVVNPGDLHTGSRALGHELRYRALYVPASVLAAMAERPADGSPPAFATGVVRDAPLFLKLSRAHAAIAGGDSRMAREHLVLEAVAHLVRLHASLDRRRQPTLAQAPLQVRRAHELIADRFAEELSIAAIARAAGMSPYHLMRQFRRFTGLPMHVFQNQLRVERGKALLRRGMAAAEVALAVGFADQSHFTKRFKELVGAPPASYQRDMQA